MTRRHSFVLAASVLAGLAACGGGGGSPGGPSGGGGGGGTASPLPGEAATITILSTGVSPDVVTVPVGSRVNFANQSSNNIEISSNPHPIHTDCPALNIGAMGPGQTRQTGALNTARTCSYHDHGRPEDERWQGSIIVR
jgi:hypothetical protein